MQHSFLVFFQRENCTYQSAKEWLERYSFTVTEAADQLIASANGFTFAITINQAVEVLEEAQEIGQGTPYEAAMKACNARFEVYFADLDAALDEINTLIELQGALQDASKGYLFLPWNGSLSEPYLA